MSIAEDYEALRQEYETLREALPTMRQARRQSGGCASTAAWLAVIAAFAFVALVAGPDILVSYGLVAPETMAGILHIAPPAPASPPPSPRQPQPPAQLPAPISVGGPLPDCASVADTRTACTQGEAQVEPTPAPQPPTAPPYLATCETVPGERPCWLPADQPWEPPADVPATPLVLIPPTDTPPLVFADSACAAWHPPLPYPEGCDDE